MLHYRCAVTVCTVTVWMVPACIVTVCAVTAQWLCSDCAMAVQWLSHVSHISTHMCMHNSVHRVLPDEYEAWAAALPAAVLAAVHLYREPQPTNPSLPVNEDSVPGVAAVHWCALD